MRSNTTESRILNQNRRSKLTKRLNILQYVQSNPGSVWGDIEANVRGSQKYITPLVVGGHLIKVPGEGRTTFYQVTEKGLTHIQEIKTELGEG